MSIKNRLVSSVGAFAIVGVTLGISGCSEELGPVSLPVTRVKGAVTEGGRPLSRGWVEFYPVEGTVGNLRSAPLRSDGSFEADGVAVGRNLIRLVSAGVRKELAIFSQFQSPIRREIPARLGEPLKIDLIDEAIRFQSTRQRQATASSGVGESR
jgi:hypothetical protein